VNNQRLTVWFRQDAGALLPATKAAYAPTSADHRDTATVVFGGGQLFVKLPRSGLLEHPGKAESGTMKCATVCAFRWRVKWHGNLQRVRGRTGEDALRRLPMSLRDD